LSFEEFYHYKIHVKITGMKNSIELLSASLLRTKQFKEFEYWKHALAYEVGWHYPLDIIWILKEIDKMQLSKKSTILDAGGGYGLLQFILASRGHDVISVDFAPRKILLPFRLLFKIIQLNPRLTTGNKYVHHLKSVRSDLTKLQTINIFLARLSKWNPIFYLKELFMNREQRGSITFYQEDFSKMKGLKSNTIDLVVSVSAIEHVGDRRKLKKCIDEFERVLKPRGVILITTSATNKRAWFHKPSQGWCFSRNDLNRIFGLKNQSKKYKNYEKVFHSISRSKYLQKNLSKYYFYSKSCGMPQGIWSVIYIPVGIVK
jgi:ubiquinone/menaquinone biosynthesis C-methylase UbiE